MSTSHARVTCTDCGFEWFGPTAAHALRLVGTCTQCRGELHFNDEDTDPDALEPVPDMPAHLVLGSPRV